MRKCPNCSQEFDSVLMICPKCGFDESINKKAYPTFVCVEKIEESDEDENEDYYDKLLKVLNQRTEENQDDNRSSEVYSEKKREQQGKDLLDQSEGQITADGKEDEYYNGLLKLLNERNKKEEPPKGNILEQGECGEKIIWRLYENWTLTLLGTGKMTNYGAIFKRSPWKKWMKNIWKIEIGDGITSIGENSFCEAKKLEEVELPDTLREIGYGAFWDCEALTSIEIPETVRVIGDAAFWCCYNLQKVLLPRYNASIGRRTFGWCKNLKEIMLPYDLKTISEGMFFQCEKLESVGIPFCVEKIETGAFENCKSLRNVRVSAHTTVAEDAFRGCPAKLDRRNGRRIQKKRL